MEKSRKPRAARGPNPRPPAAAPRQYLGFSLQHTRLMQLLLDAPSGSTVSLEVIDDVGLETSSGHGIAGQTKSVAESRNPIADRAVDLWKTLANWVRLVESGMINVGQTVFELYISAPRSGVLAESFARAETIEAASRALDQARRTLAYPSDYPVDLAQHLKLVFEADAGLVAHLICNFRLTFGKGSPQEDLYQQFRNELIPAEIVEHVMHYAQGWVKRRIDVLLEQRVRAYIHRDEFREELTRAIRKCRFRQILVPFSRPPTLEEVAGERVRTYVRQLEIIEAEEDDIIAAVNDYLRAIVDRAEWGRAGEVLEDSFTEFTDSLTTFWRNKSIHCRLLHGARDETDRGQILYRECCMHRQTLEGLEVPDYFTTGSFHSLSEAQEVGWHPEYKERLQGEGLSSDDGIK